MDRGQRLFLAFCACAVMYAYPAALRIFSKIPVNVIVFLDNGEARYLSVQADHAYETVNAVFAGFEKVQWRGIGTSDTKTYEIPLRITGLRGWIKLVIGFDKKMAWITEESVYPKSVKAIEAKVVQ